MISLEVKSVYMFISTLSLTNVIRYGFYLLGKNIATIQATGLATDARAAER